MPLASDVNTTVLKKAVIAMKTYPLNPGHKFQTGGSGILTYAETPADAATIIGYTELTAAENAVLVLADTSAFKDDNTLVGTEAAASANIDSSLVGTWISLARLLTAATTEFWTVSATETWSAIKLVASGADDACKDDAFTADDACLGENITDCKADTSDNNSRLCVFWAKVAPAATDGPCAIDADDANMKAIDAITTDAGCKAACVALKAWSLEAGAARLGLPTAATHTIGTTGTSTDFCYGYSYRSSGPTTSRCYLA